MKQQRKIRLILILMLIGGVSTALGLTLYALKKNINLYLTPTQVIVGAAPQKREFRMGGLVKTGTFHRAKNSLQVSFVLTDFHHEMKVAYNGILPALFREGQGIIVQGKLTKEKIFVATQVLAKHDEKYMPPDIKTAN